VCCTTNIGSLPQLFLYLFSAHLNQHSPPIKFLVRRNYVVWRFFTIFVPLFFTM
jgi:hypothetical protein